VVAPVLYVWLGRSEIAGHDWWDRLPAPELLPLAPLDDAASERLLRAYLGGADLDDSTRSVLLGRAQGNPFFLAELLHLLVDRGVLTRSGDAWRLEGEIPRELLPVGVQAVLMARIDGLRPVARALLRDASVAGSTFSTQMLRALQPRVSAEEIDDGIAELLARGIVLPSGDGDSTSYVFAHTLARDVAYAGVPKGDRARRHATVAAWAAREPAAAGLDVDAFVAGQAEQAVALASEMSLPEDDPAWAARPLAFRALTRLGEAALARDDVVRADLMLTRALGLAPADTPVGRVHDALVGRAAARVAMHRLDEAEADLDGPKDSDDLSRRAAALVVLGDVLRRRGEERAAIGVLVSALAAGSDAGNDRVAGESLRQLGLIDYRMSRLRAAEGRFREALAVAERVGDRRGAGWALQHLAWSATTRGDYGLAERTLAQAAEVFSALDDTGGLSWCAGTEAFVRLLQGRLHEARALAGGLLRLGRSLGDRWGTAACRTIDGFAAAELGDINRALTQTSAALAEFAELRDTWGQAMALAAKGAALRGAARHEEAAAALTEAVRVSDDAGHPVLGSLALGILGYCRLDMGDADGAEAAAGRALAAVADMDLQPAALVGLRVLRAQALRAHGRLDQALPLLREAESLTEASLVFPRRQALAHLAGALLEADRDEAALAVARRAMQVPAEDVRSRVVTLRVLAQCLARAGDPLAARVAVRQAGALARATEMSSEVAATDEVATAIDSAAASTGASRQSLGVEQQDGAPLQA
jgi:tetratricopeptide (TPR) repeat protein